MVDNDSKSRVENSDIQKIAESFQEKPSTMISSHVYKTELENKIDKQTANAWIACSVCILLAAISGIVMQMSWYPSSVLQGWPMVISLIAFLYFLIAAINQTTKRSKIERAKLAAHGKSLSQSELEKYSKNSSANSVVSLICALVPILVYFLYSVDIMQKPRNSISDQSGWVIVIYYWTIGIPIALVWLICGIHGLKSKKRNLAIFSLIIQPVGLVVFILFLILHPGL